MRARPLQARRRGSPHAPHQQRGVALIIALILVALATILATKLSFDSWIEQRRTVGILAAEQALQFAMGAEALAGDVLSQANVNQVSLDQAWAQPTQPMPLTAASNAEGEPIGTLQGALQDMQGLFNLNNLAAFRDGKPDPGPLAQFQRLLVLLKLDQKWAGIARDWIDADDQPGSPDGAEDSVYTAQNPPYRTANWPMTSPTELMNMPGFGADKYKILAPYVTALPTVNAKINVCTAPGVVLDSLATSLNGEYSGNPQLLVNSRKTGCFPRPTTLANMMTPASYKLISDTVDITSTYFRLTTRVSLGTTEFTLYSLLSRGSSGKVTPLLRTFGTL